MEVIALPPGVGKKLCPEPCLPVRPGPCPRIGRAAAAGGAPGGAAGGAGAGAGPATDAAAAAQRGGQPGGGGAGEAPAAAPGDERHRRGPRQAVERVGGPHPGQPPAGTPSGCWGSASAGWGGGGSSYPDPAVAPRWAGAELDPPGALQRGPRGPAPSVRGGTLGDHFRTQPRVPTRPWNRTAAPNANKVGVGLRWVDGGCLPPLTGVSGTTQAVPLPPPCHCHLVL